MPDTLSREDRDAAVGLLETLRVNALYTNGTERNINAIVGFMAGVRLAHIDTLTAAVEGLPSPWKLDDDWCSRAAVLAILRGEQ